MQEIPRELIIIILTLLIIELVLIIVGVYDWYKQGETLDNRYIWLIVILFGNGVGALIYLLAAPRETHDNYLDEEENAEVS
jgi:uncharacterized membrane protein YfcA